MVDKSGFSDEESSLDLSTGKGIEYRQLLLWHTNRVLTIGATKYTMETDYLRQKAATSEAYKEAIEDFEAVVAEDYKDPKYKKDLAEEIKAYEAKVEEIGKQNKGDQVNLMRKHYRRRFGLLMSDLGRRALLIELSGGSDYVKVV